MTAFRLPRPRSVRARLTLQNVAVMALLFLFLGASLHYIALTRLQAALDDQLVEGAQRMMNMPPRPEAPDHGGRGGPWYRGFVGIDGLGKRIPFPDFGGPGNGRRRMRRPPDTIAEARQQREVETGADPNANGAAAPLLLMPRDLSLDGTERKPDGRKFPAWDPAAFAESLRGRSLFTTITAEGEPVRVYSTPRKYRGEVTGVIQAVATLTEARSEVNRITRNLFTLLPLALVGVAVAGAFLTGRALRPVQEITEAAERIEARSLSGRLAVSGDDEFARLASTFNAMLGRLEGAFTRQRRFTADASHELRTPLTVIKTHTGLALSSPREPEEYRNTLAVVDQAADMMTRIVEDLLFLARSEAASSSPAPAQPAPREPVLLDDVLTLAAGVVRGPNRPPVVLDVADSSLSVLGDRYDLIRLFTNLLTNAVRHTPPEGRIRLSAFALADGSRIVVEVADSGEGIAPEHLPHVFEPFYRADASRTRAGSDGESRAERGGTGLGLPICRAIAESHGGTVELESAVGRGTVARVYLPRLPYDL